MRRRTGGLLVVALTACDPEVEVVPPTLDCPVSRQTADACCPPWHVVVDGTCTEREAGAPSTVTGDGSALAVVEVAMDGRGRTTVVGADATGTHLYDELEGSGFGAPVTLAVGRAGVAQTPQIALGPDGEGLVTYRLSDGQASAVYVAKRAAGSTWREEEGAWSFGTDAYQPEVAIGSGGDALVTWNQWLGEHYGVQVATAPSVGAPFAMPRDERDVLSPLVNFSNAPQPALAADGSFVIAWYQAADGPLLTYASERIGRDGVPTRPGPADHLSAPGAPVDSNPVANPRAALRDDGAAAVAWTQEDGRGGVRAYAALRDPDGAWQRPASLDDSLSVEGRASRAQVVFGATGDLWIAWQEDLESTRRIRVAHRSAAGAWSTRDAPETFASTPEREALDPVLVAGAHGSIAVAFRERRADGTFAPALVRAASGTSTLGPVAYLADDDVSNGPALAVGGGERERWAVAWASDGAGRLVTVE